MGEISFGLGALDGLEVALQNTAAELERRIGSEEAKRAINEALAPLNKAAKQKIHSLTGNLSSSIQARVIVRLDAPTELEDGISYKRHRKARHAHLVEGGHRGPHPAPEHPFWGPAVYQYGEECVRTICNLLLDEAEQSFMSSYL